MTDDTESNLPAGREPALRVMAEPKDANYVGDIFGGWIMSQVDLAGSIPAVKRAGGRVATVAVNSFVFKQPVFVGDVVSCYAEIVKCGRSSVTVDVVVYAERNPVASGLSGCVRVTEAVLTYVAVDDRGRPRPLPPEAG